MVWVYCLYSQKKMVWVYCLYSQKKMVWVYCLYSQKKMVWVYCLYSQKKMVWGTASTVRKRWCGCTASTVRKRWCGVLPLQSYFGPIREESVIRAEVLFTYFLGEHHLAFQLGDHCKLFKLMFPDSSIAKDFKCSRTKATAVLKIIAQDCWKIISTAVRETTYFSLQTDKTTDITITQQADIMLRFIDNTQGQEMCLLCPRECRGGNCRAAI